MRHHLIEVKRLIKSPRNARRTVSRAACEELKASILAHGLMQNLVVTDPGDGWFLVVAGGRRLAALTELQAEGKLPEDFAVPCQIVSDERALEISLAENTVRLAMHPADEFETWAKLAGEGETAAGIAARFGTSEKHVQQRLKLGNAAPELLKEYRDERLTLEALMAFAITDDRDKQLQVYASLTDWQKDNPRHIRDCLTEAMVEADSKLARFVGLDGYRAAGGALRADLFGDATYLENPELLHTLAAEKLKAVEQELKAEGWGWTLVSLERDWSVISACGRIQPQPVDLPQELLDQKAATLAELEEIARTLEDAESDELIDAQDEAESRLSEIEESIESFAAYDPEQMKIAGCYVSIGHDGALSVEQGLVRRQDMKRLAGEGAGDASEPKPKGMPEALKRDLEAYRLQIAQVEIARHPAIAFDLLVFTVACGVFDHLSPHDGPDVIFRESYGKPSVEGDTTAAERLEATQLSLEWLKHDSEAARFNEFRELTHKEKLAILAYGVALTLKPKLAAAGKEPTAYDIALALTAGDVSGYWRPTKANYLSRITRDQLLAIGREILGDPWAQPQSKNKKAELVEHLDRAFAAPKAPGRTPDQVAKLKRWLPDGMEFGLPAAAEPVAARKAREAA